MSTEKLFICPEAIEDCKNYSNIPEELVYAINSGMLEYISSLDFKLDDAELTVEIKPFNEEKNWSYDS